MKRHYYLLAAILLLSGSCTPVSVTKVRKSQRDERDISNQRAERQVNNYQNSSMAQ